MYNLTRTFNSLVTALILCSVAKFLIASCDLSNDGCLTLAPVNIPQSLSPSPYTLTVENVFPSDSINTFYEPSNFYQILLADQKNLGRTYTDFIIQAREEGTGLPIGTFVHDEERYNFAFEKYFSYATCETVNDTFINNHIEDLEVGGAILSVWKSPDYKPIGAVHFYYTVVSSEGAWVSVNGADLEVELESSTSSPPIILSSFTSNNSARKVFSSFTTIFIVCCILIILIIPFNY